jgi:Ca2+-binding RTX toxin-like protein
LILSTNATDKVTLKGYFDSSFGANYRVETIAFADGTTWDVAAVMDKLTYTGTAAADSLSGTAGYANRINGLEGNDTLNGADKGDVLSGGAGNDTLNGNGGNDTYLFNLGDGADTINEYDSTVNSDKLQFGAGIGADSIGLARNGSDLILSANATDKLTLKGYFDSSFRANYRVETIAFADGTTWDVATVMDKLTYTGTAAADSLSGMAGYANRINALIRLSVGTRAHSTTNPKSALTLDATDSHGKAEAVGRMEVKYQLGNFSRSKAKCAINVDDGRARFDFEA